MYSIANIKYSCLSLYLLAALVAINIATFPFEYGSFFENKNFNKRNILLGLFFDIYSSKSIFLEFSSLPRSDARSFAEIISTGSAFSFMPKFSCRDTKIAFFSKIEAAVATVKVATTDIRIAKCGVVGLSPTFAIVGCSKWVSFKWRTISKCRFGPFLLYVSCRSRYGKPQSLSWAFYQFWQK